MQTVVELATFQKRAKSVMSDDERAAIVDYIAANPESGVALGGGLRKVRVGREGGGKSGGYRVLFVSGGPQVPLFLVTVFAKNEKASLTAKETEVLLRVGEMLSATYGKRK